MTSVFLVAPDTDLALAKEEVQSILRSGLAVTPLIGEVTHTELVRETIALPPTDVTWYCTHGNEEGILLSDGIMSTSLLVPLIRDRFRIVVLNTCSSIQVAQALQNETGAIIIATIADVPDREAFQTGSLLASSLAIYGDINRAYQAAKPGSNRTYVLLGNGKKK